MSVKLVLTFFLLHVRSSYHKSLNHNAINALKTHDENCLWTLFGSPNVCRERDCLISETAAHIETSMICLHITYVRTP